MVNIIVLATRNAGKVKEFRAVVKDFPVEIKSLNDFGPIPEAVEDGATLKRMPIKRPCSPPRY